MQTFVVLIAGKVIIVDPGVGNEKNRTAVPGWNDLHTDFLDRLASTGVQPSDVDYVVNTHLHFDHVGWHTRLVDGVWQPTFLAARYVISANEFGYWQRHRSMRSKINSPASPIRSRQCVTPGWLTWLATIT